MVQIRGGLVRQDDLGLRRQGTRDCHPLSLAPTQLIRPVIGIFGQADDFEILFNAGATFRGTDVLQLQ